MSVIKMTDFKVTISLSIPAVLGFTAKEVTEKIEDMLKYNWQKAMVHNILTEEIPEVDRG